MTQATERLQDNDHLLPIANFTDSKQAAALAEKFGDRDLAKLTESDQAALIMTLAAMIYRDVSAVGKMPKITIWEAAEQVIPEDEDFTSDQMESALEILEGITADDAIALIQFLVQ